MRFQGVTLIFLNPNVIFIRSLFCCERNKTRCQIYSVLSFIYFRLENMESWNFGSRNSVYKSRKKKKQALTVLIKVLSVLNVVVFFIFYTCLPILQLTFFITTHQCQEHQISTSVWKQQHIGVWFFEASRWVPSCRLLFIFLNDCDSNATLFFSIPF